MKSTTHKDRHNTFGGRIYLSDFETDNIGKYTPSGSEIANRIMSDWRFDRECRKNAEGRDRRSLEKQESDGEEENSELIFPPGYYIREIMRENRWSKAEFAGKIGISELEFELLLVGKRRLGDMVAKKLAEITGTSVGYWKNLQKSYERGVKRGGEVCLSTDGLAKQ